MSIPVNMNVVVSFISHLYQLGYSSSTICSYMSPISYIHKISDVKDPTSSFFVNTLLLGTKRKCLPDSRLPILPGTLYKLVDQIKFVFPYLYSQIMIRSMLLGAFHCFFSIGEYTMTPNSKSFITI